jgi:hypothetical protein
MAHIQQREIPAVRFGSLVEFDGRADSHTDERYFGADPKGSNGGGYADMRGARPIRRS